MQTILAALRDQLDELEGLIAPLDDGGWHLPSACEGWDISDVVLHLAQTNELAVASASGDLEAVAGGWGRSGARTVDDVAGAAVQRARGAAPEEVHRRWRASAEAMVTALGACRPDQRVQWVAGDLAARTLATTRLAETWIHTGDVAEGLGATLIAGARLWHIARLAHRTISYALARAGAEPPGPVRFVLLAPEGEQWTFGDEDAPTVVTGPALDLCRVAGQRASPAETALLGTGPDAARVLALVRTFA